MHFVFSTPQGYHYREGIPMTTIEQATQLPEHVRVRLRYTTATHVTETALLLGQQLGVPGPYAEEVWILLPKQKAFSILDAYQEPFVTLKAAGVVPADAELASYRVESAQEPVVLAYILK